jgi:hypothetical protein
MSQSTPETSRLTGKSPSAPLIGSELWKQATRAAEAWAMWLPAWERERAIYSYRAGYIKAKNTPNAAGEPQPRKPMTSRPASPPAAGVIGSGPTCWPVRFNCERCGSFLVTNGVTYWCSNERCLMDAKAPNNQAHA